MKRNTLKPRINLDLKFSKWYIIIALLLFVSVGYSLIRMTFSFQGTAFIQGRYNIYFDNLVVNPNSASTTSPATIDNEDNLVINFDAVLSHPDDFYEFEVDLVNASAPTAKLVNFSATEIPDTYKNYIDFTIKYLNNVDVAKDDFLVGRSSNRIKVRVGFKTDVNIISIIDKTSGVAALNLPFSITFNYEVAPTFSLGNAIAINSTGDDAVGWSSDSGLSLTNTNPGYYFVEGTFGTANPIYFYRGNVPNNNLVFANKCWKIIRTTDTGGIRIIYNGDVEDGKCLGTNPSIGDSKFNNSTNALNYAGYMYDGNSIFAFHTEGDPGGSLFGILKKKKVYGSSVSLGSTYSLSTTTEVGSWSSTSANTHHYTCFSTSSSCKPVNYVFKANSSNAYYVQLNGEANIDVALGKMIGYNSSDNINITSSTIKGVVDSWYENNLYAYNRFIEDSVYCNDRSVSTLAGWSPSGSASSGNITFGASTKYACNNNLDKFTTDSANGNGALRYPIGLITKQEAELFASGTGSNYWTMTPNYANEANVYGYYVNSSGAVASSNFDSSMGVRPVITLKGNTEALSGNGTADNPYIVIS